MKISFIKREHTVHIALFVVAVSVCLPLLFQPMLSEADAYIHVTIANLFKNEHVLYALGGGIWLPLQRVLFTIALWIYDNPLLVPRIVTLFFNSAAVVFLYTLTISLFEKVKTVKFIALTTAALYIIFPFRLFFATQTLTEPMFVFFLLGALHFFLHPQSTYLAGLAFLLLAQATRFEAWFLLPFFLVFLWKDPQLKSKEKIWYSLGTFLFPLWWLFESWWVHGNAVTFFWEKRSIAQAFDISAYGHAWPSLRIWLIRLWEVFPFSFLMLWVVGLIKTFQHPHFSQKQLLFLSMPVFLLGTLVFQVFAGTMEWFPHRYLFTAATLSLPLIAFILVPFIEKIRTRSLILTIVLGMFLFGDLAHNAFTLLPKTAADLSYPVNHFSDLREVVDFYSHKIEKYENLGGYIYAENQQYWLSAAFFYFAQLYTEEKTISDIDFFQTKKGRSLWKKEYLIFEHPAWEKWHNELPYYYEIVLENASYVVIQLKNISPRFHPLNQKVGKIEMK